jgi:hypothetical protein
VASIGLPTYSITSTWGLETNDFRLLWCLCFPCQTWTFYQTQVILYVYLCEALNLREGLAVIPVTDIFSVVAMIPEMMVSEAGNITHSGKYRLMRHAFIELAPFNSGGLFDKDDEDETEE